MVKHPQFKCPDKLKPVFRQVREHIKARMAAADYFDANRPTYICHVLMDSHDHEAETARLFIQHSLHGYDEVLSNWLRDHDPEFQAIVAKSRMGASPPEKLLCEDNARIAWLDYLTGDTL